MMKLHIAGAAVALGLLAAPPVATAQQTRWYLAEGSTGPFFEEEVAGHQPDQSDGDRHRPRLSRRRRRRHPDRHSRRAAGLTLPVNLVPASPPARRRRWSTPAPAASQSTSSGRCPGTAAAAATTPAASRRRRRRGTSPRAPTGSFFSTFILLVNPNPSAAAVTVRLLSDDGPPADFPYTVAAQQPADHSGQRPAAVPQRQLRDGGHRVAAGLRRARDVLARLPGRPRRDRGLEPGVDVALRRGLHRRRLRDLFPARQPHRRLESRRR